MNQPFEGDTYIPKEIEAIKHRLGLTRCVETGTQYARTTNVLSWIFQDEVVTVEADPHYVREAEMNVKCSANIKIINAKSQDVMDRLVQDNTLFYLDAHGCEIGGCPLKEELEIIAKAQPKNIAIAIHDFKVPGKDFGYDTYDYPLEWSEIEPIVKRIFKNPVHYYNEQANGAYRGIVYIHEAIS